jgi:hypothetical protein
MNELDNSDLRIIGYALEKYRIGTVWSPLHKQLIEQVLEKIEEIQLNN